MAAANSHRTRSDKTQASTPPTKKNSTKLGGAFKRVGRYLQEQAQQNSHSALYLSPRDPVVQRHFDLTEQELLLKRLNLAAAHPDTLPFGVIPPVSSKGNSPRSSSMTTDSATDSTTGTGIFSQFTRHQYASENILQSYDILIPDRQQLSSSDGYFLIFIHGGYFRDPKQTSKSFNSTVSILESSETTPRAITNLMTGYASINYRLAPHPGYPQDPKTTPSYTLNNAYWPDQPNDILSALRHIQSHYPQSHRYILAGHSVGATLSFIATLRAADANLIPPIHLLGICGIYDFPLIHKTNPDYDSLTGNAMRRETYTEASPALYDAGTYRKNWASKVGGDGIRHSTRRVMLAHSRTDELVNWEQVESMDRVFRGSEGTQKGTDKENERLGAREDFQCDVLEIAGSHYSVLEDGEVARCFRELLEGVLS